MGSKQTHIVKSNIKVATFMGYNYFTWQSCIGFGDPGWKKKADDSFKINGKDYLCRTNKEMRYHESLDWLTPVLSEIKSIGFDVDILSSAKGLYFCMIHNDTFSGGLPYIGFNYGSENIVEAVFETVVSFINWYNSTPPPSR